MFSCLFTKLNIFILFSVALNKYDTQFWVARIVIHNFELHEFFNPPKNVRLKALVYFETNQNWFLKLSPSYV